MPSFCTCVSCSRFTHVSCKPDLTLTLLMWKIWCTTNNATRWQMGFNLAFKGLNLRRLQTFTYREHVHVTALVSPTSLKLSLSHWNEVWIYLPSHVCYMSHTSHLPQLDHINMAVHIHLIYTFQRGI